MNEAEIAWSLKRVVKNSEARMIFDREILYTTNDA
jgi:hypothetical protein